MKDDLYIVVKYTADRAIWIARHATLAEAEETAEDAQTGLNRDDEFIAIVKAEAVFVG